MPELLENKLHIPKTTINLIPRTRLLKQLSQVEKWRFASLIAPAGYGKTVLMMQLAGTIQQPLSWYQLDEYDNDPAVFLQYLVAAIRRHLPGYGKEALNYSAQPGLAGRLR